MRFPGRNLETVRDRIDALARGARALHESEVAARAKLTRLAETEPRSPLGRWRLARAQERVRRVEERRARAVVGEFSQIIRVLSAESERTRLELDDALERLVPLERRWTEIELTFRALDEAIAAPELEAFVGAFRGALEVPEFPVREEAGYVKPFPARAFVF